MIEVVSRGASISSTTGAAPVARVWWLSPSVLTLIVVPTSLLAAASATGWTFMNEWRTAKSITPTALLLFLAVGLTFAVGTALPGFWNRFRSAGVGDWAAFTAPQLRLLRQASTALFLLTLVGYGAFAVVGAQSGLTFDDLSAYFTDAAGDHVKSTVGTVVGVTTMTQFGVASVVVSAYLLITAPTSADFVRLGVVVALAALRALFFSERLAILEVVMPVLAVFAIKLAQSARWRSAIRLLSVVFLPGLVGVFALFEYNRSWAFFSQTYHWSGSFLQFALQRLAAYYATAYNNGYLLIEHANPPDRLPTWTVAALWQAPGVEYLELEQRLSGHNSSELYDNALRLYGNPEFNNPSGIGSAIADYGVVGGAVFLLLLGVTLGLVHESCYRSHPIGLLLLPVVITGVLDLPRYLYWTQGRVMPAAASLVILAVIMMGLGRAERRRGPSRP